MADKENSGHTALITGASAGLGREFVELCAADGHNVVLVARRKDRLEQAAETVRSVHGVMARVIAADLSDPATPQAIFEELSGDGVAVDYLVNNAGFGSNGAFVEMPRDRELSMIEVNVSALTALCHLFLPGMIERKHGRILNVGSTAGFQAGPFMATYYASKAYVNHFSEALWHEVKDHGVTVTVSCPGATATEFAEVSGNDKSKLFAGSVADAQTVAREAYEAMMSGRRMIVHGFKNKMLVQSLRLSPRGVVQKIARGLNLEAGK